MFKEQSGKNVNSLALFCSYLEMIQKTEEYASDLECENQLMERVKATLLNCLSKVKPKKKVSSITSMRLLFRLMIE